MLMKLRWWLIRKLIPTPEIEYGAGGLFIGKCLVKHTPTNLDNWTHDAVRAFHCGGYTYFFYAPVEEWKSCRELD